MGEDEVVCVVKKLQCRGLMDSDLFSAALFQVRLLQISLTTQSHDVLFCYAM